MTEFLLSKLRDPNTKLKKTHILPWGGEKKRKKKTKKRNKKQRLHFSPLDDMILDPVVSCSFNSHVCQTEDRKPILPPAVAVQDCIPEHLKRHLLKNSME